MWVVSTAYADNTNYIWTLYLTNTGLNPRDYNGKGFVISLRCVSYFTSTRRYPLSYVFSGYYYWSDGDLSYQDFLGGWWSTAVHSSYSHVAHLFRVESTWLLPQDTNGKVAGYALHCVSYSTKCPSVSAFVCIVRSLPLG